MTHKICWRFIEPVTLSQRDNLPTIGKQLGLIQPSSFGHDPCFLVWKFNFFLIGGSANSTLFQSYNTYDQTWTEVTTSMPIKVHNSACLVLPNDDILVVGSEEFGDYMSAAVYNVGKNYWTKLPPLTFLREGTSLVRLGNRVFAIGGLSDTVEEFHPATNTWSLMSKSLIIPRIHHSSISLPASKFATISGGCQGVL